MQFSQDVTFGEKGGQRVKLVMFSILGACTINIEKQAISSEKQSVIKKVLIRKKDIV